MLALSSPHLLSTTYRWPLDNIIAQNLNQDFNDIISTEFEANSYHSLLDHLPTYDHIQQDFVPEISISKSSGRVQNASIGDPKKVAKKLNHNASERYRRKRVNDLYSFLRSVLPTSGDQKRKESIPRTVSRALKYIPELQKEVETLSRKREKLLSHPSSTANTSQDSFGIKKKSVKERKPSVVSSVSVLGEKEAVIQLIFSTDHKEIGFLSKVLEYLEQEEEDGLVLLINSTTFFKCLGEGALVNTLHLQVQGGDKKIEAERLKAKLCSFYQQ